MLFYSKTQRLHYLPGSIKNAPVRQIAFTKIFTKEFVVVIVWPLSLAQLFWDPMDCSLPGSFVHVIFQTRTLEWFAISF